jgi:hypothetical protein
MYLHIGNGKSLKVEDIVGIFDLDTATVSKITKKYISKNEKSGLVEYSDFDLPRTFVVCSNKNEKSIKLSRISSQGLCQRIESETERGYKYE